MPTNLLLVHRRGFDQLIEAIKSDWTGRWQAWAPESLTPRPDSAQLVVVCCDHPDAFRSLTPELLSSYPLAEFLVVAGPWLRAFGRTRSHWPAAWLVTEAEAISRLAEIAKGSPITPKPITYTRAEQFVSGD